MSDDVRRGDIWALGRHRLACIDATDKAAVARLFAGGKPTLVVTSPPYADARDYNDPIPCWDSMMLGALDGHDFADDVQILVNLGVIHRRGEWVPYWWGWLQAMRKNEWLNVSQYVWDKTYGLPGQWHDRMRPAHEFVFHLRRQRCLANKWQSCAYPGPLGKNKQGVRKRNGNVDCRPKYRTIASTKVPDSVIRLPPVRPKESTQHPAQMPIALASFLMRTWRKDGCLVYDPFGGSGTTLLACEDEGVDGLSAEISAAYVQLAIDRWRKANPDQPVLRLWQD